MLGKGLLYLSAAFDADGNIDFMFIKGRANRYLEYEALRKEINRHPEWTDSEVNRVLHQRGMQFGPETTDRFLAIVRPALDRLASALGGVPRNVNATFDIRVGTATDPTDRAAALAWKVDFEVNPNIRGRATTKYILTFEPMGGKVQSIIKVD